MRLLHDALSSFCAGTCVAERMREHHIQGCTIAMIHEGQIVHASPYGIRTADGKGVTDATLFECASLTKIHFAAMALKLCEDGLFFLDVPIVDQYSEAPWSTDIRYLKITPRHVLSHSSGLPNWSSSPMPVLFSPGDRFSYSGEGYFLLQRMLEKITGRELDSLLESNIFHPLGMDARVLWTEDIAERFSCGFDADGRVCKIRDRRRTAGNAPEPNAAWSLYANAFSVARFLVWLLGHHAGLGSEMFRLMTSPCIHASNQVAWGLGAGLYPDDPHLIWHWGDNQGFQSLLMGDTQTGDGLVITTNSSSGLAFCFSLVEAWTDFDGIPSLRAFLETAE